MPLKLPFSPDYPEHSYTVALDGSQYGVRLVYRDRTASWYLDLEDADGNPILQGRRLSPGFNFDEVTQDGPPGMFYVTGADPYDRDEIELIYFTGDEVESARASAAVPDTVIEITE